ncbi:hypothetical protein X801_03290, partial [Opisthorchis viverrini]
VGSGKSAYRNTFHALSSIISNEGFFAIYSGLSAGLLRQATYSTCRLGIYTSLFDYFSARQGKNPNFVTKLGCAMTSGVLGSFVGTPSEVCLIRMTSDGRLPVAERRNYTNVFNALIRIYREEGLTALWRGAIPTMGRAAVVNGAQLASYSQTKQQILESGFLADGIFVHFLASMFSGFVTSVFSLPVDIIKTRIQNMKYIDGKPEYSSMSAEECFLLQEFCEELSRHDPLSDASFIFQDVFFQVVRKESVFSLWKGFTPYFFRLGPHTVLTFIFLEQLNRGYRIYVLGDTGDAGRHGGL